MTPGSIPTDLQLERLDKFSEDVLVVGRVGDSLLVTDAGRVVRVKSDGVCCRPSCADIETLDRRAIDCFHPQMFGDRWAAKRREDG